MCRWRTEPLSSCVQTGPRSLCWALCWSVGTQGRMWSLPPGVHKWGEGAHSQTLQILEEEGSANSEARKMRRESRGAREARGGRRGSAVWGQFWKKQRCLGGQSRGLSCREGHFWQRNGICGGVGPSGGLTWDQGLLWSGASGPRGAVWKGRGEACSLERHDGAPWKGFSLLWLLSSHSPAASCLCHGRDWQYLLRMKWVSTSAAFRTVSTTLSGR